MTDLTFMAISVAVLCVGWRLIAGPEPKPKSRPVDWFLDGVDSSCEWGTCDCVGKCEKRGSDD